MLTDQELQTKLEASPAERVTKEYMESRISAVEYGSYPLTQTTTYCNILLDNGYSVRGEAACVNPENFNLEIGQKISYDNAFQKLWPLFGFLLAEKNHQPKSLTAKDHPVCAVAC